MMTQGRPQYATRRDANQAEIVDGLERLGYLVLDVSQLAHLGFDLLVCGWHQERYSVAWLAVEVKAEDGTLTEREREFFDEMTRFGEDVPALVAHNLEDVLNWFGRL
jgi:hypothetical protein